MLEILISSSVLILVLAILRLILRDKISARLQYALWLLVLVRLLVPVSFFHSSVSVAEAAAPVTERMENMSGALVYMSHAPVRAVYTSPENEILVVQDAEPNFAAERVIYLADIVRYVRYAGMAVMAAWFLFVNVRFARRLRRNRTPYDYNSVMPVYVAEGIPSPCLFGLFKPTIYLTERAAEDDTRARQIEAHELTHYRHGDMIWALLRSVCLVVWWFNPLVWLAAALSRQDCELACDEGTIKALGEDARFDYGRTLVGMAAIGARPSDLLCGATTMTTGKKSLKERVARIANAPKMSVAVAVIVLIIAAVAVGCTYGGSGSIASVQGTAEWAENGTIPAQLILYDPDRKSGMTVYDEQEITEMYGFYRLLREIAEPLTSPAELPDDAPLYAARFSDVTDEYGYRDIWSTGLEIWESGQIIVYRGLFGDYEDVYAYYDTDGIYIDLFEDILDEYHSESVEAKFVSGEPLGGYDRAYWEEVDRELASFAYPADIEVSVADGFDEALPEDDIFGPMTLEDYIYGTDSWQFRYNGEAIMTDHDPYAWIKLTDADGRALWIMDDADALMIEEADGSVTWGTMPDGVDCADMIRHLLPWARGEYDPEAVRMAQDEAMARITDEVLGLLGQYRLGDVFSDGVVYIEGSSGYTALWLPLEGDETIPCARVYEGYSAGSNEADLEYIRYYTDDTRTVSANAREFARAKEHYHTEANSFLEGLSVNGYEAYCYSINTTTTILCWYDTDSDLIFLLSGASLSDQTGVEIYTADRLIALAESVTAQ